MKLLKTKINILIYELCLKELSLSNLVIRCEKYLMMEYILVLCIMLVTI